MTKPLPPHGSVSRYRRGCRCEPCRTAKREYGQSLRRRTAVGPGGVIEAVDPRREAAADAAFVDDPRGVNFFGW